jgi:hypothetical protein
MRANALVFAACFHANPRFSPGWGWCLATALALAWPGAISGQTPASIRLNEVLANNVSGTNPDGVVADWVELYNPSPVPVDLSDASLTDSQLNPRRFVFPPGSWIAANGFRVLRCSPDAPVSGTNTGFGLKQSGDAVFFYDRLDRGGLLIDAVVFGLQAADFSIGRLPNGTGNWGLNLPSPGGTNAAAALGTPSALRINEWMSNPRGNQSDFIELYNTGSQPVMLSGLYLTDDLNRPTKFLIGALSFVGVGSLGGFALFLATDNPSAGPDHLNFGLNDRGEQIGLYNSSRLPIDTITFTGQAAGASEGFLPDGSHNRVTFPITASPGLSNRLLGIITDVAINELLTHTDPPLEDALELLNLTDEPIDLGGWVLEYVPANDVSFEQPSQYQIPSPTILPARGFAVFYEDQLNGAVGMRFNSAHGGKVVLYQTDGLGHQFAFFEQPFGPAQNGVSFGRYPNSDGGYDFVALSAISFGVDHPRTPAQFVLGRGAPNPGPRVGPVVISEIMNHPPDVVEAGVTNDNHLDEYIELRNITDKKVPLFDPLFLSNRWRLRNAVEFDGFPFRTYLPPRGFLLVVSFDPVAQPELLAAFRLKYDVPPAVPIFGPYSGELSNSGDTVELVKPDPPQGKLHPDVGFVPTILVEKVKYRDDGPWPAEADGGGMSLQRRNPFRYGNDATNWKAAAPTPGRPNGTLPIITTQPVGHALLLGQPATFTVAATGTAPLFYQWRHDGEDVPGANEPVFTIAQVAGEDTGSYSVVVSNDEGAVESAPVRLVPDTEKPSVTVTSPKPGARVTTNVVLLQGTAADKVGLAGVLVSVNGAEFTPAAGMGAWSFATMLVPGTNVLVTKAVDTGLNESTPVVTRVVSVVLSSLTLSAEHGVVTPDLNGQLLEVGHAYTLKAAPAAGYLFRRWAGDVNSSSATLSFLMRSNLVLTAQCVPNPFLPLIGPYAGLFYETPAQPESSGACSLQLGSAGTFTAVVQRGSKRASFAGSFDLEGRCTNTLIVDGRAWSVELALQLHDPDGLILGRIVVPEWTTALTARRAGFVAKTRPYPYAGTYTFFIPGTNELGVAFAGDGFGTLKIDVAGRITVAGTLADGSKLALKTSVAAGGQWPIHAVLGGGAGSLVGWAGVVPPAAEAMQGSLAWFKAAGSAGQPYSAGFAQAVAFAGSRYRPPVAGSPLLAFSQATVELSGGALTESFSTLVRLGSDNRVSSLGPNAVTLVFNIPTGLFSGKISTPGGARVLGIRGAADQQHNLAAGHFLDDTTSGRVLIVPIP